MGEAWHDEVAREPGAICVRPLTVEIITYAPTEFFHCLHCEVAFQHAGIGQKIHAEQREANLPSDLREDFERLSGWVEETAQRHPNQIQFKLIDAASLEGVFKSIRRRVRTYPTIIVESEKVSGYDLSKATDLVDRHLALETGP